MRALLFIAAGIGLAGAPSFASAESAASCKDGAMPFQPSAATQLTGAPLQQAVTGKRLVYARESIRVPGVFTQGTR
jgi:hypothetical protein